MSNAAASIRKKNELLAQKERQYALKHLEKFSCGPSSRELMECNNVYSNNSLQMLDGDNTLASMAARKAKTYPTRTAIETGKTTLSDWNSTELMGVADIYHIPTTTNTSSLDELPHGWKKVRDPSSGDDYYWNESTDETTWDFPKKETTSSSSSDSLNLPRGWKALIDDTTGETYYWNQNTGATQWEVPLLHSISIAEAMEAKSKLDGILDKRKEKVTLDSLVEDNSIKKRRKQ